MVPRPVRPRNSTPNRAILCGAGFLERLGVAIGHNTKSFRPVRLLGERVEFYLCTTQTWVSFGPKKEQHDVHFDWRHRPRFYR